MNLRTTLLNLVGGFISTALVVAATMLTLSPVLASEANAQPEGLEFTEAGDLDPEDFLWQARLIVVFADSDLDPRFTEQISLLEAGADELFERDVIVIMDTTPAENSAFRTALRPRGFMMVLIGKDGAIRLRKPFPWDAREISRSIDKIPLRQQEMRDRRAATTEAE